MKKNLKKRVAVSTAALVLAVSVLLTGCGGSGSSASAGSSASSGTEASELTKSSSDSLNISVNSDLSNLDPTNAYSTEVDLAENQILEGLFYYDENAQIQPRLAESYTQPDDTTYVYEIRQGVTFSDGTPLTADDVVFSLQRQADPKNNSLLNWMFTNVKSIEKTGDYEVTVKLSKPDSTWQDTMATTASLIVSKDYYEKHKKAGTPEGGLIGTGAYVIDKWDKGVELDLKANDSYWDKDSQPEFKTLKFLTITDSSVVKAGLQSGKIDMTQQVSPETAHDLDKSNDVNINATDYYGATFLSANVNKKPLNDVNVRKAIDYAIDKKSLVDSVYYGKYAATTTGLPFSDSIVTVDKDAWNGFFDKLDSYDYDPDKAKEYLAKAEKSDGFDVTLAYDSEDAILESVALAIQANLQEVGINVKLQGNTLSEITTLRYGSEDGTRDYDLLLTYWGSDYPDPIGALLPMYDSSNAGVGGSDWTGYKNKEFDQLMDEQASETGTQRAETLQKAVTIINNDIPNIPLFAHYKIFATSKKVDYHFSSMLLYNIYLKDAKIAE